MKNTSAPILLVVAALLTLPLPAYANNPPQTDGMLGLVLIFPLAILGRRLAGVELTEKQKQLKWRIGKGLLLAFATFISLGGAETGGLGLLVIILYCALRFGQIIQRGQGRKRLAIAAGFGVYSLFAASNYFVSLAFWPQERSRESWAATLLRRTGEAETQFQAAKMLDANKNGIGEYGTFKELEESGLGGAAVRGYRYVLVLSGDPARDEKEFFVYATPEEYDNFRAWEKWRWIPGYSWAGALRTSSHTAQLTLATDESGVIRAADLSGSRPVTREETRQWKRLEERQP